MHTMVMVDEREGTEEWFCSACGRHLLVSWFPEFKKTVLQEGDPAAKHTGLKQNVITKERERPAAVLSHTEEHPLDDPWLAPWLEWMEKSGFESLWNKDLG